MVKTRPKEFAALHIKTMDTVIAKFGRTMTHRLSTETVDANGVMTAKSTADATFDGDLQYGPEIDRKYASWGVIDVGEGVLFVSPSQSEAANITPHQSLIIEGSSAGTYQSWEVIALINGPTIQGSTVHYEFRVRRRLQVTLS